MNGKSQNKKNGVQQVANLQDLIASMVNEAIQKALENINTTKTTKKSKSKKSKQEKQKKQLTPFEKIKNSKNIKEFKLDGLLTKPQKLKALDIRASKDYKIIQISGIATNQNNEEIHLSKNTFRNIYMDSNTLKKFIQILYSEYRHMEGKTKAKEFLKQLEKL